MDQNTFLKNIDKFALPKVSFFEFKRMLQRTSPTNTMEIKWRTAVPPTHRTKHEVFWGPNFSNSDQSLTKEAEGMVNLEAPNTIEGWRTLTYDNISSFKFEGKSYTIIY